MAEIARKLKYRRADVTYSIDLYDSVSDVGSDYLAVKIDGSKAYAQLGATDHEVASHLRVKKGGTVYAVLTTNIIELPSGFIGMFESTCPDGWTRFDALDGKFPMPASSGTGTGGSSSHVHTMVYGSIVSGTGSTYYNPTGTTEACNGDHTHNTASLNFNSASSTIWPPYLKMVFCKKD